MKRKTTLLLAALSCASAVWAANRAAYPGAKVAQFVLEKLDVNSLPSAFRPQKEKGRKTFADYGFAAETVGERQVTVAAVSHSRRLVIKVLDVNSSGIFVCLADSGQNGAEANLQTVVMLKRKDPNGLLKSHITFRDFSSCPSIGGTDSSGSSY